MGVKRRCVAAMAMVLLALGWLATADAASMKKVAVLELINKAEMTDDEAYYLTDLVRNAASRILRQGFLVITRESLFELLPPDVDPVDCTSAECEVELGRLIGADYIVTGEILVFAGELRANLRSHHSKTGEFIGSSTAEGKALKDLESSIKGAARELCGLVRSHAGLGSDLPSPAVREGEIGEAPGSDWQVEKTGEVIVHFESDPTGAMVEIGDQPVCEAPCSRALRPDNYDVAMKKVKWVTKRSAVEVKGGMGTVSWKLEPDFGWLTVQSNPSGLDVSINGKVEGKTPITRREMVPSSYEVLVTDSRYYDQGKRIRIERGEDEEVDVELKPRQGGIKVEAKDREGNAVEGDVYVGGRKTGRTYEPITHIIGTHKVEVRSGQGNWFGQVIVEEKKVSTVEAKVVEGALKGTPSSDCSGRFIDNGDGTVTDTDTGLMWQQKDDNIKRKNKDTNAYCEGLELADYTDWRLPDRGELRSIVDKKGNNPLRSTLGLKLKSPTINTDCFPDTNSAFYWSSSTLIADFTDSAWIIDFKNGGYFNIGKGTTSCYVRCVRP
ncbi:DUF1566 domain-containing protein [Thermodesulfobacteriota bacterium]